MVAAAATLTLLIVAHNVPCQLASEANRIAARGAAGYLGLLAQRDLRGRIIPAHLLSLSSTLAVAPFWDAGLQVAWGSAPLLPDTIALVNRLEGTAEALEEGRAVELKAKGRGAPAASVVPLLSPGSARAEGWVAVWNALPKPESAFGDLVLLAALSAGLAGVAALGPWAGPVRWLLAGVGGAGLVVIATLTGAELDRLARQATDLSLLRVCRLVEIAATASGVRASELQVIFPEAEALLLRPPFERFETPPVRRDSVSGDPRATVIASIRSGFGLEIRARPVEADLEPLRRNLLLVAALGVVGLVWAVWAAGGNPRSLDASTDPPIFQVV